MKININLPRARGSATEALHLTRLDIQVEKIGKGLKTGWSEATARYHRR